MTNSTSVGCCDDAVIVDVTAERAEGIVRYHYHCEPPCPRKRAALLYLAIRVAAGLRKLQE